MRRKQYGRGTDALGHAAGDRLLVAVADRLRAAFVQPFALVEGLKRRLI